MMRAEPGAKILLALAILIGRIPFWVPLLMLYTGSPHMNIPGFFCFTFAFILARCILFAYENDTSLSLSFFTGSWQLFLRPVLTVLFIYIALWGAFVAFSGNDRISQGLVLGAWLIIIALTALFFFGQKKKRGKNSYTPALRDTGLRVTVALLWLYLIFIHDSTLFTTLAVCFIYLLEFASTWELRTEQSLNSYRF